MPYPPQSAGISSARLSRKGRGNRRNTCAFIIHDFLRGGNRQTAISVLNLARLGLLPLLDGGLALVYNKWQEAFDPAEGNGAPEAFDQKQAAPRAAEEQENGS